MRIIVLGYVVRGPVGGLAWHHLHYVRGLLDLGHDVYFLEDSDDYPSCYDPIRHVTSTDATYGLQFAQSCFDRLNLGPRWAYYDAHTQEWKGPMDVAIKEIAGSADLLLNVSGVNPIRPWLEPIPVRVFIDTDPCFTQIRHLGEPASLRQAALHSHYFTFGSNIGRPDSRIPDDGFPWQPTRQPLALREWPAAAGRPSSSVTTVMQWDSYPTLEFHEQTYGTKAASFEPYLDLPSMTEEKLEIALGSADAPRLRLRQGGWVLTDPLEVTKDPWTYQRYIQLSKAEFSVAKHGYVVSRSGWFSERSANYLASGRPVIAQDTGFTDWMATGTGVLPFSTQDEALAAIDDLNTRYKEHSLAARELAIDYFDSKSVLTSLIERALSA